MDYNTSREKIMMPEYGRLVQNLVEFAAAQPERETRQHLAECIVKIMANCNPQNRNVPGFRHKLWDHLAMISKYSLDIDYPFPITPQDAAAKPKPIPYSHNNIRYRQYGHLVGTLLNKISEMPDGEERDELARLADDYIDRCTAMWEDGQGDDRRKDADRYSRSGRK